MRRRVYVQLSTMAGLPSGRSRMHATKYSVQMQQLLVASVQKRASDMPDSEDAVAI